MRILRPPYNITEVHFKQHNGIIAEVTVAYNGEEKVAIAAGNGRLNAVSNALKKQFRLNYDLITTRSTLWNRVQVPGPSPMWGSATRTRIFTGAPV